MTLQKLTNRSVDRYLADEKFREEIETYDNYLMKFDHPSYEGVYFDIETS